MTIRLASRLHRNRYGVYGFRVVIPRDLRVCFSCNEFRVSLRTSNTTQAKKIAAKYSSVTDSYFDKIRQAPSFDDALATGQELLQALSGGGNSFDSLTDQLGVLLAGIGDVGGQLLKRLVALRREFSEVSASKQSRLQELAGQLAGKEESTPDAEIDSLVCDFYADAAPLVARENAIRTELNDLTLTAQRVLLDSVHQQDVDALRHSQKVEISSITDLAAEIAAKTTAKVASMVQNAREDQPTPPTRFRASERDCGSVLRKPDQRG